jgi:hypothetical protein
MTHQLIGDVVDAFGRHLERVRITEVRDNIFYAELILDRNTRVSARAETDARGYGPTVQALVAWAGSRRRGALSAVSPGGRHAR